MSPEISNALPFVLIGAVLVALAIWLLLRANRKTTVIGDDGDQVKKDVLDEGAAPAARNQVLIDAPKASESPQGVPIPTPAVPSAPATESAAAPAPEPKPAAEPAAAPVPESMPAPSPAPVPAQGDDLRQIKGIGPKLVTILAEQGVTTFAQIASWSDADVERIDASLGRFAGRITRDQWVEQAKLLAKGDNLGFSEKFGNNEQNL